MNRKEALEIINDARTKEEAPNLSGANLCYADLSGADLSRANLSRANLCYANLSRAKIFSRWILLKEEK